MTSASVDWWVAGQSYAAPDQSETIVRASTVLYIRPKNEEGFRELITLDDQTNYGPGFSTGHFVFEDYLSDRKGVLICNEGSCTVQYEGKEPVAYEVSLGYHMDSHRRLSEFDRRQVPASLYKISGTEQLVYFSRWVHGMPSPSHMYVVEGGGIHEMPRPRDATMRGNQQVMMKVPGHDYLFLPPTGRAGDGKWGERNLVQLDLAGYDIVHDDATGDLVSLTPKS